MPCFPSLLACPPLPLSHSHIVPAQAELLTMYSDEDLVKDLTARRSKDSAACRHGVCKFERDQRNTLLNLVKRTIGCITSFSLEASP